MDNNFIRVFWHEVGHFIAHHYNNLSPVESIVIVPHEINGSIDYEGFTKRVRPSNYDPRTDKLINLPEKICSIAYGCYFQSIYMKTPFEFCFDWKRVGANGFHDSSAFWKSLTQFSVDKSTQDEIYKSVKEHFRNIEENNFIVNLFKSPIEDIFRECEDGSVEIDIPALSKICSSFLKSYERTYSNFLYEIKRILNWNTNHEI